MSSPPPLALNIVLLQFQSELVTVFVSRIDTVTYLLSLNVIKSSIFVVHDAIALGEYIESGC
jgi:hypothetical protein